MGIYLTDIYTIGHITSGAIGYYLLKKKNVSLRNNFLIANIFHLFLELLEHNKDPNGKILETNINHFADIIGFFGGWYVAMYVKIEKFIPDYMTVFVWIYIIIIICAEIHIELYPHNNGILKGSFMDS